MKKFGKAIVVAVGISAVFTLGQMPAQADTQSAPRVHVISYDTGWD